MRASTTDGSLRGLPASGRTTAASIAAGFVAAVLLVAAPFVPADVDAVTGAILCGFALGWAMLAVLSAKNGGQPQPWALLLAAFMAVGGILLIGFGSSAREVLAWVWPPTLLALVVWTVTHARLRRSRGGRWLVYPILTVLALASVGGGYETLSGAADAQRHPIPGQLVAVGGHSLHLDCTGSGSPTVVLEAGGGEMSSAFGWIAPGVSAATRVCVYDRAGHGWSEPAEGPQEGAQVAADLHTLLHRARVPGPFVLAGHSFGGLYALAFADRFPDEVVGMVMVDSTAPAPKPGPGTVATSGSGGSYLGPSRVSAVAAATARLGLPRLVGLADFGGLPPRSREEMRAATVTEDHVRSTVEEYLTATASMGQAAALEDFGDKPLVVLTAGSGSDASWIAAHRHLTTLSTNSEQRTIDGATHSSLVHDEDDAGNTTRAILDVVSSARSAAPLMQ